MNVVGFTGLIGSGKTLAADWLCSTADFKKLKMADPLKTMLRSVGLDYNHIEGSLKEKPCELLCGKTPRYAMQTLGTEWGRHTIGEDVWVNMWAHQAQELLNLNIGVVTDDIRYENEARIIREMDGFVIRIVRPDTQQSRHISEEQDFKVDYTVQNNGSPEELTAKLYQILC